MIEFTILEMTLMALCAVLFYRNGRNAHKFKAMIYLVGAMCEDESLAAELRKHHSALFKGKTQ